MHSVSGLPPTPGIRQNHRRPQPNLDRTSRTQVAFLLLTTSPLSFSSPTAASSHHPLLFSNYSFTVLSSVILLLFTNSFSNLYYYLTRVLVAFLLSGYRSRAIRFQPPQSFFFFFMLGLILALFPLALSLDCPRLDSTRSLCLDGLSSVSQRLSDRSTCFYLNIRVDYRWQSSRTLSIGDHLLCTDWRSLLMPPDALLY